MTNEFKLTEQDEEMVFQEYSIESTQPKRNSDSESAKNTKKLKGSAGIHDCKIPKKTHGDELFIDTSKNGQNDDSPHGKLLTKKLRSYSVYERNLSMYEVDTLVTDNPPGLNTSNIKSSLYLSKDVKITNHKPATSGELHSTSEKAPTSLTSDTKSNNVREDSLMDTPQQIEETNRMTAQEASTSKAPVSSVKANNPVLAKLTNSVPNKSVKVTGNILNSTPNSQSNKKYIPVRFSIENQPARYNSNLNQPVKVMNKSGQPIQVVSVPAHLPLKISIPENKLLSPSKFVPSSFVKGKIVITKSKSSKLALSQPILMIAPTLPTVAHVPVSPQSSMNSLELSSVATYSIQKQAGNSEC